MLARLISAGQAVLLYTQSMLYLFHKEEVHRREGDDFSHIPINKRDDNFAMWTLIDSGTRAQPLIENWCRIWPIQVTPPNPIRWKAWRKQRDAALLGMPLWNMKELEEGYVSSACSAGFLLTILHCCSLPLFPEYGNFRAMLKESLENNQADSDNKQIDAALKVLQEKDFHYERGDGPPATDQDTETPVDRSNLDCAFKVLLENAIEEFGHAPRDVYNGVFYLPTSRRERDEAVYFANYSALASFASKFSRDRHLDSLSHKLIKVEPTEAFLSKDGWDIDFKSAYILGKVMASARSEHDGYLWRAYHAFRGASASTLAGYLFEEIIHRIFAHGWMGVTHEPQLTPMVADGKPPPTFSSDPASAPLPTSSFPPLFAGGPMDTVVVDFTSNDLNITLSNKKYYRPRDYKLRITDNTLFDSFTVSLDPQGDFLISIFQITVSKSQGGSAEGYERIRKIIQCVKALAEEKEPTANVKVAYFLVCPEDELRKWKMPVGWNANNQPDDHCGEAFCVRMHVPGAPRLFASNFVT